MTERQLKALQSYVTWVTRVMTNHDNAHGSNVRGLLDSKRELEAAFNTPLDYPDLFGEIPTQIPRLPDIL